MKFVKMHGLGNDFILLDATQQPIDDPVNLAVRMCDRHFGIGADGILIAEPSKVARFRMRIVNSDGSEARMCGNGIRCMAAWAYERGLVHETRFQIETVGGVMGPRLVLQDGHPVAVEVDMGEPRLSRRSIPMLGADADQVVSEPLQAAGETFQVTMVSMGNPHCVIFVPDVQSVPLHQWGPPIEHHAAFPERTNVEFVQVEARNRLIMRVWERGAGPTLACGTGACATLVAANLCGLADREATVELPGGPLQIAWRDDNRVYMTGPFTKVFEGDWLGAVLATAWR